MPPAIAIKERPPFRLAVAAVESLGHSLRGSEESRDAELPEIRRIKLADLKDVLARGLSVFLAVAIANKAKTVPFTRRNGLLFSAPPKRDLVNRCSCFLQTFLA